MNNETASGISKGLEIRNALEESKDKIAAILPAHLKKIRGYEDRLIKAALVAVNNQPTLLACTPTSIVSAVMKSAELGLDPSGTLGSGYLIAYGNTCTFSIGYRGLIDLVTRGDSRVIDIEARVVYEKDTFEYSMSAGSNQDPFIVHKPPKLNEDRGVMIGAYMVAHLRDGAKKFEVMDKKEIDFIRSKSKSGATGAWRDFPGQMARKVVIRRGINYLPLSPEVLSQVYSVTREDDEMFGINIDTETNNAPDIPEDGKRFGFGRKGTEDTA